MKRLIALAAMLVISACSAGNLAPSEGVLIRVDFSSPAWQSDAWLLQVVSPEGIQRNVVVDPAGAFIMVNYTMMCNFDGRGAGGACIKEIVQPAYVGRWYDFTMQAPTIRVKWEGEKRYSVVVPAGWRCPVCNARGVEMMPMK